MLPHLCIVSTISLLVCDSCGWSYSVYFSSTLSMSVEAYWNSCTTSSAYTGLQTMINIPCCGSWRWWRRFHSRTEHSAHKLSSSDQISAWWRSLVCSSRRISARCWSSSCPCWLTLLCELPDNCRYSLPPHTLFPATLRAHSRVSLSAYTHP